MAVVVNSQRAIGIGELMNLGRTRKRDLPINLVLDRTLRPKIRAKFGGRLKALAALLSAEPGPGASQPRPIP